jgi:hypothetical protein
MAKLTKSRARNPLGEGRISVGARNFGATKFGEKIWTGFL